jgi:ribosomal protein S18 acetylase RimI-like enzyme
MLELRPYRESDEAVVAALWHATLGEHGPHNEPVAAIHRRLALDDGLFLVATLDSVLVGTVVGGYDGCRGWIHKLAVDPAARRQGIARALVARLEELLAARGCLKVNLQVRASNREVVAVYEKLGYDVEAIVSLGKRLYGSEEVR